MLTCLSFLVLSPSLNYFRSLIDFLSPLFTHLLNRLLPISPFTHSMARSLACCLPPFLTRPFIHLLAHIPACLLSCSLPSSLTSYHTSLLRYFFFPSFLYALAHSFACFVPFSLAHLPFSLFPSFTYSPDRFISPSLTHSLACLHVLSLTRSLPCFFPFIHSFACSLKTLLARLLSSSISHRPSDCPRSIT